ncbi:acyltransferase [Segetibacter koreensis]|uniref:acyltransferase n=1 Tax=Segetibacter koreensis TaxID=398037 RepID=UPI0003A9B84F|nr:acyltransferase family protein [Segetibacter koreensis]
MKFQHAGRNYSLDVLRVLAIYMVVQIHTGEFYYIAKDGNVLPGMDAYWVGWYNSLFRSCVPLFVMISGFFLFPVKDVNTFYRKRLSRVVIPFVIWCILYAFYQFFLGQVNLETAFTNILRIPVNFGTDIGHLWYVYMLIGLYLFAPVISPWIESASEKNIRFYLVLWAIAMTVPYLHIIFPELLGEAYWNKTPLLYYFSGFMGYAVLAFYIKRFFLLPFPGQYVMGAFLIVAGYAITAIGFIQKLPTAPNVRLLELTWGFETINVAMITAGLFLIIKNIKTATPASAFNSLLFDVSRKSYGIYLGHIMVLNAVHSLFDKLFTSAAIKIPIIAVITFITTYIIMRLLSYLPKSKYFIG